jgi:hypothetical protein
MSALNENSITRLATVSSVDLNTVTPTELFVPSNKTLVATHIVIRSASASLTGQFSIGFNVACNDVIANASYTELIDNTVYTVVVVKVGAKTGTSSLNLKANTLQAATVTIEIFGYLF